jgi:hypothetical protein
VSTSAHAGEAGRSAIAAINQAIQATEESLGLVSVARHGLEAVQSRLTRMANTVGQAVASNPSRERAGPSASPAAALGAAPAAMIGAAPNVPTAEAWAEALRALQADAGAIDKLAAETRFGELHLLDGSCGLRAAAFGPWLEFVSAGDGVRSSPPEGFAVELTQEPTRATVLGEIALTRELIAAGEVLELEAEDRVVQLACAPGQTPADVAAALQAAAQVGGLELGVVLTSGDRLLVHHRRYGKAWRFCAHSRTPGILSARARPGSVADWVVAANGRDVAGTINGEPARGEGQILTGLDDNRMTAGLAVRYTGTPPPGFEPPGFTRPDAHTRGQSAAPRDGWKDGVLQAGRVLTVQRALAVRMANGDATALGLRLDSVACAMLGRNPAPDAKPMSVADALTADPAQAGDVRATIERARGDVRHTLDEALRLERDVLSRHLAQLRVEAQNLLASGGIDPPADLVSWVAHLGDELRRAGTDAFALQRTPRPSALLRLLSGEGEPGAP